MKQQMLVIHQGALGDVVLSFPALLNVKRDRDTCISLLARGQIGNLAQRLGVVDSCFRAESARFTGLFSNELRQGMKQFISRFDAIVIIGFSEELERNIKHHHPCVTLISPRPPVGENTHVADHIIRQIRLRVLNTTDDCVRGLTAYQTVTSGLWHTNEKARPEALLGRNKPAMSPDMGLGAPAHGEGGRSQRPLSVIHPGAGSYRKRWTLDKFVKLAQSLGSTGSGDVLFMVGPAEKDLLPLLADVAAEKHVHVQQVEDLNRVIDLFTQCRCFVGNDSGLAHLAGFVGVPTVAIFGPSSPRRWAPVGRAVKVLRGAPDCPACFETEQDNCEHPRCLTGVSVDQVVEAIGALGAI